MGSERISNALKSLAGGLSVIAEGRYRTEEKESDRAFQREMLASREALETRMLELRQTHDVSMLDKQQTFAATQGDKEMEFKREMFQSEQAAMNARHSASLGAEWARIKQAGAQLSAAQEDKKLERQLKVFELEATQGQEQYKSVLEAMNKEMAKISEQPMMMMDKKGDKRAAAEKIVTDRYAPMLEEAKNAMMNGMSRYASAAGTKADFSDVQSSTSGEPSGTRDKVSAAVEAAKAQIGSGQMPPEQNLIAGFMKSGLSRTEALAAARQLRSSGGVR